MSSSIAWDIATHVRTDGIILPSAPPAAGQTLIAAAGVAGSPTQMGWGAGGGGGPALPVATAQYQFIQADGSLAWVAGDTIFSGNFNYNWK